MLLCNYINFNYFRINFFFTRSLWIVQLLVSFTKALEYHCDSQNTSLTKRSYEYIYSKIKKLAKENMQISHICKRGNFTMDRWITGELYTEVHNTTKNRKYVTTKQRYFQTKNKDRKINQKVIVAWIVKTFNNNN